MIRIATARHSTTAWLVLATLFAASVAMAKGARDPAALQVEVQMALCSDPDEVVRALGLEPRDTPRETWLFDDGRLTMFERGLRFRVRATDSGTEVTLKAAVDHCTGVSPALVPAKVGKCEYDMHGDSLTAAVSLSTRLYDSTAKRLIAGRVPLADVLSAPQVRYLTEAVKLWPLPPDLRQLGPIDVIAYRAREKPYDVDVSRLPSGEHYVEISRRVALADAAAARKGLENDLARGGIAVCADQSAQAVNKMRALLRTN
jgi:hypothetical protein